MKLQDTKEFEEGLAAIACRHLPKDATWQNKMHARMCYQEDCIKYLIIDRRRLVDYMLRMDKVLKLTLNEMRGES